MKSLDAMTPWERHEWLLREVVRAALNGGTDQAKVAARVQEIIKFDDPAMAKGVAAKLLQEAVERGLLTRDPGS